MKKNLRIIYGAFIGSLLVILVISYISSQQLNSLIKYNDQITKTDKVIFLLSRVEILLREAESSQRGFFLTNDSSYLKKLLSAPSAIYPLLDSLKKVVPEEKNKQDLIKIRYSVAARLQGLNETIEYSSANNNLKFEQSLAEGKNVMDDFLLQTSKFQKEQTDLVVESEANKKIYEVAAPIYLRVIFVLSMIFQIGAFILIIKEFRRRHKYQKELEQKVNELNMSHAELEQIAFIASHDLKEPLRKMRTFGGRLLMEYKDTLDESGSMMLNRIDFAARRMQGLIEDLVDYTQLINSQEEKEEVNLNKCITEVQTKLANIIQNRRVKFIMQPLPVIHGYPYQLHLLFTNLIHNSIKFSKPDVDPIIEITFTNVTGEGLGQLAERSKNDSFLKLCFNDNGIGFENEFAKKIFVMFQRLHNQNSSYGGKGIGLSICKRVMTNHNGFIDAEGEPEKGATFNLYFPINN